MRIHHVSYAMNTEETTEHLLACKYYKRFAGGNLQPVDKYQLESVEWLVQAVRTMEVIQEVRSNIVIGPALKGRTLIK